jgi:hypothetical protein
LPRAVANAKLTAAGFFFRIALRSLALPIGDSFLTHTVMYSRTRMLSGVRSW